MCFFPFRGSQKGYPQCSAEVGARSFLNPLTWLLLKLSFFSVSSQLYRRIPFGYHPIKLERDREDYHGPCARMTRYDTHSHKSRSVPRLSNPETLKSLNPNDSKALLLARDVDSDWWPKLCPSVPLVVRGVSLKPRNPTKITLNPMSHTRCRERQNRECLREREGKREREKRRCPPSRAAPMKLPAAAEELPSAEEDILWNAEEALQNLLVDS